MRSCLPALGITFVAVLVAQVPRFTFEVASIRPSADRQRANFTETAPGGERFTATNVPLKLLVMTAYDVNASQISGGPTWMNTEFFDIQAKPERPGSQQQIHLMLRSLLEERFSLRVHKTTEERPIYILTAENYQSKIHPDSSSNKPHVGRGGSGQTIFENVPIAQLAYFLQLRLRRDVVDKTGLNGNFDFELAWTPDVPARGDGPESRANADPSGPWIGTALKEQLGLRLTATKAPVEVIVIDAAAMPSVN